MDGLSILISGDLVPTKTNSDLFANGDLDKLIGTDLNKVFDRSDCRIFNLEVPITDKETPIAKHGPNLRAATNTMKGIKAMNPTLVTLANNHIMDHDKQGLISTLRLLDKYNIYSVGAGRDIKEASEAFLLEHGDIVVGIYACADHEFTIATEVKMGANPFDPLESLDHIYRLKKKCDYEIVLYHGGKEQYPYPSPYLQKVCRKMVEKGADLVICQHSHCIGCIERYLTATICYGQGNFLFDGSDHELWKTGLILEVLISKDSVAINYLPIIKCDNIVRLANKINQEEILNSFLERSRNILQPEYIEKEYQKLADLKLNDYMKALHGGNYLYRIINKVSKNQLRRTYSKKQLLAIENYISCDAHRELLLNGLRNWY